MKNPMIDRIQERLETLGMTQSEAEAKAALRPGYLSDLLRGKKQTIRIKATESLARALDCDPRYLTAEVDVPRPTPGHSRGDVRMGGIAEPGVWRAAESIPERLPVSIPVDRRYPAEGQLAFLVRGHSQEAMGIKADSILITSRHVPPRPGDLVVVTRTRANGEVETTVRQFDGASFEDPATGAKLAAGEADLAGTVIIEMRVF